MLPNSHSSFSFLLTRPSPDVNAEGDLAQPKSCVLTKRQGRHGATSHWSGGQPLARVRFECSRENIGRGRAGLGSITLHVWASQHSCQHAPRCSKFTQPRNHPELSKGLAANVRKMSTVRVRPRCSSARRPRLRCGSRDFGRKPHARLMSGASTERCRRR